MPTVAEMLDVSPARVRQMVEEGKLPAPIRAGDRATVWPRDLIEQVVRYRAGEVTAPISLLSPAPAPLERVVDVVFEYDAGPYSYFPSGSVTPVHVRVWRGLEEDEERVVVVLGQPEGVSVAPMTLLDSFELADAIDTRLLDGAGEIATWLIYTPGEGYTPHVFTNILFTLKPSKARTGQRIEAADERRRGWLPKAPWSNWVGAEAAQQTRRRFDHSRITPATLSSVEAAIGQHIECYPAAAYTTKNIELYARTGGAQIEVEDDAQFEIHPLIRAIGTIEARAGDDNIQLGARACEILASVTRQRLDYRETAVELGWNDATQPRHLRSSETGAWPQLFAARLALPALTPLEQQRLDSYSATEFAWPSHTAAVDALVPLLEQLRAWISSVDEFSAAPDPDLHGALSRAADHLDRSMRSTSPRFAETDYPPSQIIVFHVDGDYDRRYLDQVTWDPHAGNAQRRRELTARFLAEHRFSLRFGLDPDNHLVAHALEDPLSWWAAEWTTRPYPIPTDSHLVVDAHPGDLAAYVEMPNGTLKQLPRSPGGSQWNHGYSGGGSGALAWAVIRALRPDNQDEALRHYDRLICEPSKTPLRIPLTVQ